MKHFKYIAVGFLLLTLSCSEPTTSENQNQEQKCLCDSINKYEENEEFITDCFIGKSLITIKSRTKDTTEVTRYYTEDTAWHVQEYLILSGNKIIDPEYAIYCDINDTSNYYKLTFNRNETLKRGTEDFVIKEILGLNTVIDGDTLVSKFQNSILIPKEKLKGKVQLIKKIKATYRGEEGILTPSIYLIAEDLINYGSLHNQFLSIRNNCIDSTFFR